MRHSDEEEGQFFAVNEAVPLLKWSSISEYSVSHGRRRRFARARQRNYNKRRLSLPARIPIFHPSLFYLPSVYAVSKGLLLLGLTCVLARGR